MATLDSNYNLLTCNPNVLNISHAVIHYNSQICWIISVSLLLQVIIKNCNYVYPAASGYSLKNQI